MLQRNMADSSTACLTQPLCYSSVFSNESNNKSNIPSKALEESVSLGRFTTESLAWEKWSTFSRNRYVEEAERFAKPGSVAQKKAFFEAHYKKLAAQKAAALLEQEKNDSLKELEHVAESKLVEKRLSQSENNVDGSQLDKVHRDSIGIRQKQVEDFENVDTRKDLHEKQGSNYGLEVLQSIEKSTDTNISERDSISTTMNNKSPLRKKRSNAKSLHMSIKFALIRQVNKFASLMKKFETTRVGSGSSLASKDRWTPLTTPSKVSKNELQKHPSFSPLAEKKRNNMRSPIKSSSFGLKTEEKAGRRKKKLWKRSSANKEQKEQLNIKHKERPQRKTRKLKLCFCFKPRQEPEFISEEEEDSKRGTKEETPGRRDSIC